MTRVGLLFPGEMGALVGSAVQGEVLWASEGRSEATTERAEGFTDVGTVRELVAASEIVISLCPPAIAEDVAGEVAAEGLDGIYVEANAIAPERVQADRRATCAAWTARSSRAPGSTSICPAMQRTSPRSPRSSPRAR